AQNSQGIQTLLEAEKEAAKIVNKARQYRVQRLKDARTEAAKDIEALKLEKNREFANFEQQFAGTSDGGFAKVNEETEKKLVEIQEAYQKNKALVIEKMLAAVTNVQPTFPTEIMPWAPPATTATRTEATPPPPMVLRAAKLAVSDFDDSLVVTRSVLLRVSPGAVSMALLLPEAVAADRVVGSRDTSTSVSTAAPLNTSPPPHGLAGGGGADHADHDWIAIKGQPTVFDHTWDTHPRGGDGAVLQVGMHFFGLDSRYDLEAVMNVFDPASYGSNPSGLLKLVPPYTTV
ncbi:H(+)-transporting V1 sector ATPase subunit G, partial [Cladochytrium tenue]